MSSQDPAMLVGYINVTMKLYPIKESTTKQDSMFIGGVFYHVLSTII